MRKPQNFLAIVMILSSINLFAQINLEKTYVGKYSYTIEVDGVIKYYTENNTGFTIYNFDHSILKTITVPQIAGYNASGAPFYFSTKLFDNDGGYEYFTYYTNATNYSSLGKIYNEDGTVILTLDSTNSITITSTSSGTKMIGNAYNNKTGSYTARVYGLPGSLANGLFKQQANEDLNPPYPNPASTIINLPYSLPPGATGELTVYNIMGIAVRTYAIGSDFNEILVNTSEYTPGSYTYTVTSPKGTFNGKTFIVQ